MKELKFEELTLEQKLGLTMNMVLHGPADEDFVFEMIKKRAVGSVWIQYPHETADRRLKIINELVTKGYQRDEVNEYVQNELCDVNFAENCAYIIENKFMPLPSVQSDDFKKMMGALMRYGYSFAEIKGALTIVTTRGKENE